MNVGKAGASGGAGAVGADSGDAPSRTSPMDQAPMLPVGELGIAGMVAMLVASNASQDAKFGRKMEAAAGNAQAAALERQVAAMREKANHGRTDAIISGSFMIAGGAMTVASVAVTPSAAQGAKAGQLEVAARTEASAVPTSRAFNASMDQMKAGSEAMRATGGTLTQLGPALGRATAGKAREDDEADSTRAAADAKFHETAKDEYASLVKEARSCADKVNQFLQAVVGERQMTSRAIMKG